MIHVESSSKEVEEVKRSVAYAATCGSTTIAALKRLLSTVRWEDAAPRKNPSDLTATRKVKGIGQQPKRQAPQVSKPLGIGTKSDVKGGAQALFSKEDQQRLATEVVNVILKSFTEKIASQTGPNVSPCRKPSKAKVQTSLQSPAEGSSPLKPVSGNIIGKPSKSRQAKRPKAASPSQCDSGCGIAAQAECGRLALAWLRISRVAQGKRLDMSSFQVENAMSAFIGKLISLNLHDSAMEELRILHGLLATRIQLQTERLGVISTVAARCHQPNQQSFAYLIYFQGPIPPGQSLSLVITTQFQVLDLLSRNPLPEDLKVVLEHLKLEAACSPGRLIELARNSSDAEARTLAVRRLGSLARIISILCNHFCPFSPDDQSRLQRRPDPLVQLQYHTLFIQIRTKCYKLTDHHGDMARDFLRPFYRSLSAVTKETGKAKEEIYWIVTKEADQLLESLELKSRDPQEFAESLSSPVRSICQCLMKLALVNGLNDEAMTWARLGQSFSKGLRTSSVCLCSWTCRVADCQLRLSSANVQPLVDESSLLDAIQGLAGDLRGDSDELDDLLIAINSLRRALMSVPTEISKSRVKNIEKPEMVKLCIKLLSFCMKYLVRYSSKPSSSTADPAAALRYQRRRESAAPIAAGFIESIAQFAEGCSLDEYDHWTSLDSGLQHAVQLLRNIEGCQESILSNAKLEGSVQLIVDLYWRRLVMFKEEQTRHAEQMFRIFEDWLYPQNMLDIYMKTAQKYGRYADQNKEWVQALKVFNSALKKYLASQDFHAAVRQAATESLKDVWTGSALRSHASQILLAYPKEAIEVSKSRNTCPLVYDNVAATDPARGLVLELQLSSLLSLIKAPGTDTEKVHEAIAHTVDLLLSLYTQSRFPIRRLRVVNRILALQLFHPERSAYMMTNRPLCVSPAGKEALSEDLGLQAFESHLLTSHDVLSALQTPATSHEVLESAMKVWQTYCKATVTNTSLDKVEDMLDWLEQLDYMSSFLAKEGQIHLRCSALEIIRHIREKSEAGKGRSLVRTFIDLVTCYIRRGDLERAGLHLLKGKKLWKAFDADVSTEISLQVSSAQYALASGDFDGSRVSLSHAQDLLKRPDGGYQAKNKASIQGYCFWLAVSEYCCTCSALAEAEAEYGHALLYGRLGAKTIYPLWLKVRDAHGNTRDSRSETTPELKFGTLYPNPQPSELSQSARERQLAWLVGPRLFEAFFRLAQLYEHLGLFVETRYYVEEAQAVAKSLGANVLLLRANIMWGHVMVSGGLQDNGDNVLEWVTSNSWCTDLENVEALKRIAKTKQSMGDYPNAMRCYDKAGALLKTLKEDVDLCNAHNGMDTSVDLATQLADLSLAGNELIDGKRSRVRQPGLKKQPASSERNTRSNRDGLSIPAISRLEVDINQDQASIALTQGNLTSAQEVLDHVSSLSMDAAQLVHQNFLDAQLQICQLLLEISGNLVFSVLIDSAVALPSTISTTPDGQADRAKNTGAAGKHRSAKVLARQTKGDESSRSPRVSFEIAQRFISKFEAALQQISITWQHRPSVTPTRRVYRICKLFTKTILMLSSFRPHGSGFLQPQHVSFIEEFSSIIATSSARQALHVERVLPSFQELKVWQYGDQLATAVSRKRQHSLDRHAFQQQYLDIIPSRWLVLSLSMNESRDKLQITKLRKGCTPFMLSLPLERQGLREPDDEEFGFHAGQQELQNIMEEANASSQKAKDASTKASYKTWWSERSRLDNRLKGLLANIEKVWLGGFRGVLSTNEYRHELVARFQQSMQNILDKHLPSRQRGGSVTKAIRVKFDIAVAELFTGLGNPNDGMDIDEALLDLIYFIVDILQFQGERNAYDEIDFDTMTIEVTDALRQFHEAAKRDSGQQQYHHTILILDKTLHAIPWESLDCLKNRSISRLPSLECLRERVLRQREQQTSTVSDDLGDFRQSVRRSNGAYILNPSGDLKHTQVQFEEPLQELQGWEGIVEQVPSEGAMAGFLSSKDILLYFGHGCGSQYVRPRDLRRLDQCAVTLLMGCSSGVMTEAGDFESYGIPLSYMHAGSSALLATLWDVTDKDIDRFSMTALQDWGLLRRGGEDSFQKAKISPVKRPRGKGKAKADAAGIKAELPNNAVSLCQAVANARDNCILKYLNGAAPVVYGIPVFVDG